MKIIFFLFTIIAFLSLDLRADQGLDIIKNGKLYHSTTRLTAGSNLSVNCTSNRNIVLVGVFANNANAITLADNTCLEGTKFLIHHSGTGIVNIKNSGGTTLQAVVAAQTYMVFYHGSSYSVLPYTTSLASLGTIPVSSGGTGLTSPGPSGNALVSNGTDWVSQAIPLLPPPGASGEALVSNGSSWVSQNIPLLPPPGFPGDVLFSDGTNWISQTILYLPSPGPIGEILTSDGAGGWISQALPVTDVAGGGTGRTTLTANNVLLGNGTSPVNFVAPGASGNVLTSNGTSWVSQAAGSGSVSFSKMKYVGAGAGSFTLSPAPKARSIRIWIRGAGGESAILKERLASESDYEYTVSGSTVTINTSSPYWAVGTTYYVEWSY